MAEQQPVAQPGFQHARDPVDEVGVGGRVADPVVFDPCVLLADELDGVGEFSRVVVVVLANVVAPR